MKATAIILTIALALLLVNFHTRYYASLAIGESMLPTMPYANFCILQQVPPAKIKEGDVVQAGRVQHRLIQLDGETAILKGDNNQHVETCRTQDIRGKLIWHTKAENMVGLVAAAYCTISASIIIKLNTSKRGITFRKMVNPSGEKET